MVDIEPQQRPQPDLFELPSPAPLHWFYSKLVKTFSLTVTVTYYRCLSDATSLRGQMSSSREQRAKSRAKSRDDARQLLEFEYWAAVKAAADAAAAVSPGLRHNCRQVLDEVEEPSSDDEE